MDTQKQTRTRGRDLLTDGAIKAAKATGTAYKLRDGGGLYLLVTEAGAKLWRLRFVHPKKLRPPTKSEQRLVQEREQRTAKKEGRAPVPVTAPHQHAESMISLGPYPEVSLAKARARALDERTLIEDDIDPAEQRKKAKRGNTFEAVAREWLALQKPALATITYDRAVYTFERLIFPPLGAYPINALTVVNLTDLLISIDSAGNHETARRVHQRLCAVFKYAKARGDVEANIATDIDRKTILTRRGKVKSHAAITDPVRIGELLRAVDGYTGSSVTRFALQLSPLLFVRPGELRHAEWTEFELDSAQPQWLIPAPKMKMRRPHIVPLSTQAVTLLRALRGLTGKGKFVFPAMTTSKRPLSENTANTAIRRLGYDNTQMTAHGFRTMASTRLNEGWGKHRFKSDWIEMQLAHGEEDSSRAAYNGAQYIDHRRRMMQLWADYLDSLRAAPAKAAA
jgi:integrase